MTKAEYLADPESALNKAADDEPLFILRANDPAAALAIRSWAGIYFAQQASGGRMNAAATAKWQDAHRVSGDFVAWHVKNVGPLDGSAAGL